MKVLLAGALPALVIAAMLMLQIGIMARRQNLPRDVREARLPTLAQAFVKAFPALLAPVILIGGLVSGLFGPMKWPASPCSTRCCWAWWCTAK